MKYKGEQVSGLVRGTVKIKRPGGEEMTLTLTALPMGADTMANRIFPIPVPPEKPLVDDEGRQVMTSKGPRMVPNYDDPEYQSKVSRIQRLQNMVWVYQALRDDPDLTFETEHQNHGMTEPQFYEALYEEMCSAGFTMGDQEKILQKILEISGIREEVVEAARDSFRSGAVG